MVSRHRESVIRPNRRPSWPHIRSVRILSTPLGSSLSELDSLHELSPEDFSALVRGYVDQMWRVAARISPAADVDDVVQDSLLIAWRKRSQFDGRRGSLSGWLMAITANEARRTRRQVRLPMQSLAPRTGDVDRDIDIERAMATLPERQRLAINCFYFAGLSVSETASVMNCSDGTVKSTLSDARRNLRARLES